MKPDCIVIGGGAAGMMAAITAAAGGAAVTLLERNQKVGRKLYITGKGRCNVTNNCSAEEVLRSTPCNGKFLYSCMERFPPAETMAFFEKLGVPLKTERGSRVFPTSDKAADIIDALLRELRRRKVDLVETRATGLLTENGAIRGVRTEQGEFAGEAVILATGGVSYPLTGSTGDGYEMARSLGHTVVPPKGSLVPLCSDDPCCPQMQGLALKNTGVKVKNEKGKVVYQDQGELLFTHFGLSGPVILSASAHLRRFDRERYTVCLDLKPALDEEKLDARLLREFEENSNRDFINALGGLLPRAMVPVMVERTGIPPETKVHSITRAQRRRLLELLKCFPIVLTGPRPVEEAIVTSGGIKVSEIDPKTMQSRLVPGLFFAGEIIDVDAYTGGFNLQIAWATGHAAGQAAARTGKEGKL
ncbi:MAG: NAD(P)/FAD-dependent oxidoreductase [Oscillospiraceae bacterium]